MNNKCKHCKNGGRGKRGKLYMTFLFPGTWHKFLITRSCGVNEAYEWEKIIQKHRNIPDYM